MQELYLKSQDILEERLKLLSSYLDTNLNTQSHIFTQNLIRNMQESISNSEAVLLSRESLLSTSKPKLDELTQSIDLLINQVLMEIEDNISKNFEINKNNEIETFKNELSQIIEEYENIEKLNLQNIKIIEDSEKEIILLAVQIRDLNLENEDLENKICRIEGREIEINQKMEEIRKGSIEKRACEEEINERIRMLKERYDETCLNVSNIEREVMEMKEKGLGFGSEQEFFILCQICGLPEVGRMKKCMKCEEQVHARCTKELKFVCAKCRRNI